MMSPALERIMGMCRPQEVVGEGIDHENQADYTELQHSRIVDRVQATCGKDVE